MEEPGTCSLKVGGVKGQLFDLRAPSLSPFWTYPCDFEGRLAALGALGGTEVDGSHAYHPAHSKPRSLRSERLITIPYLLYVWKDFWAISLHTWMV